MKSLPATGIEKSQGITDASIIPMAAIAMYVLLIEKLATRRFLSSVSTVKRNMSHVVTSVLIGMSIFGGYQLLTLLPTLRGPHTPIQSQAQAAAVQKIPEKPHALQRSTPLSLNIPALGLEASVTGVGQNSDGSMEIPGPNDVGWYTLGPSPGELGPAIIVGHVDYVTGPAIFWKLRDIEPGNQISVNRGDGSTVKFSVEKVATYDQNNFPTDEVYGNLDYPGLRLITCDGDFNYLTHHYSHNLVVYARANL
jgi:sortase (surface protein transpeptidase)